MPNEPSACGATRVTTAGYVWKDIDAAIQTLDEKTARVRDESR
jgi:hypothetical protein